MTNPDAAATNPYDIVRALERLGRYYWEPDGIRSRVEFQALADASWKDALVYFIQEFAYERQGASRDYARAAVAALEANGEQVPTAQLAEPVWNDFEARLGPGAGPNMKNQPIAPSFDGMLSIFEFLAG